MIYPKQHPWTQVEIDQLCDLVAEDCYSFREIARIMGRSHHSVTGMWTRIRETMEPSVPK